MSGSYTDPWPLHVGEAAERHGCNEEEVVPLSDAERMREALEETALKVRQFREVGVLTQTGANALLSALSPERGK